MGHLIGYLEQEEFDVDSFVERLARQALGGETLETNNDIRVLRQTFEHAIGELTQEFQFRERTISRYEERCSKIESTFHRRTEELLAQQKATRQRYKHAKRQVDHIVATTSYLGEMLEGHDYPRSRLLEAESLVAQFEAILSGDLNSARKDANDASHKGVSDHAHNVLKLHLAASELMSSRYNDAKQKIADEYSKVEAELLAELSTAQRYGDTAKMKEIVGLMSNFRGYGACVDQFILNAQKKAFIHPDVFQDVMPLTRKVANLVQKVFPYPECVMGKFVLHTLSVRIANHVTGQMQLSKDDFTSTTARQLHLARMAQLYTKTRRLCEELQEEIPMDIATKNQLRKVPKELFQPYIRTYQALEYSCMRTRLDELIRAYYQSIGHLRKSTTPSPLRDFRRGIQSKIAPMAATIINVAPSVKDYGGETFICETLAVNMLQELRESFERTSLILRGSDCGRQALALWELFLHKFVREHLLYGVHLGIKTIPVSQDHNQEPKQHFLRSVYQTNAIFHLVENTFYEEILPLLSGTAEEGRALRAKRESQSALEESIRIGLKRSIKSYTAWIRVLLEKQKYNEFLDHQTSPTARKVIMYTRNCITAFDESLDGQNQRQVMFEFGRRFHKALLSNIRRFRYSHNAGLGLLCDITEYRTIIAQLQLPIMIEVFDTLYKLCNLLIVPAENLLGILHGDAMSRIDAHVAREFIQLREDCRSHKLLAVLFPEAGG
ncbi:exocyst complex component 5-like isoform X1 [Varroa destructor]|uniref:Exocyst complex component 5 n=2 Tax=Varroa destructor TaxID=109461 RepID=A0A7M7MC88_VARDE|nr:exocyst complex component 5-like isoform X1 [Varroa destructor]XP_022651486.1 exocyst complex component 5-like isoform X1 [Varroa destructor]XP_022651487.1 exocyst complex component 5-like isoform X1 [Varroa destructor]XP_022651488.1 exocyst complex component 5-like isoform X1 [Varroa destructor]XP_022651489.1 exocyst complex component 5-like isoform X1 [Varroa destructor]XP_022651491.1 exocyst complex component 5-like isoform X1 [Varroa destructor]